MCVHARQKLAGAERLYKIIVGAGAQSFDLGFLPRARRKQNHRHGCRARLRAQTRQQFYPIHPRHHHITE
ncbi:MAG: hypothetical protein WAK55_05920, partial [Xanthobacteraceae bacterium]